MEIAKKLKKNSILKKKERMKLLRLFTETIKIMH